MKMFGNRLRRPDSTGKEITGESAREHVSTTSDNYVEWNSRSSAAHEMYTPEVRMSDYFVYPLMIGALVVGSVGGLAWLHGNKEGIERRIETHLNGIGAEVDSRVDHDDNKRWASVRAHESLKEYRFRRDPAQQAAVRAVASEALEAFMSGWPEAKQIEQDSTLPHSATAVDQGTTEVL